MNHKNLTAAVLLLGSVLGFPFILLGQDVNPAQDSDIVRADPYRLSFMTMMFSDAGLVEALISKAGVSFADDVLVEEIPFQMAVLNINLILLTDDLRTLDNGIRYLNLVPLSEQTRPLYKIYSGMAEAFLARRWTIFGFDHLKNAERYMSMVPDDFPDWYIRLLRGFSLFNLGRALPSIGPVADLKERALAAGEADLRYVIDCRSGSSLTDFDAETYDWETLPVPSAAASFAEEALRRHR